MCLISGGDIADTKVLCFFFFHNLWFLPPVFSKNGKSRLSGLREDLEDFKKCFWKEKQTEKAKKEVNKRGNVSVLGKLISYVANSCKFQEWKIDRMKL